MAFWFPAAAMAAGSAINAGTQLLNRTPKFKHSARGRELTRQSREGAIPVGRIAARVGNQAASQQADIRGYLAARGQSGSIAGARALAQPGIESQRITGDLAERNELTKTSAREQLAAGTDQANAQRRGETIGAVGGLVSGLAGATAQYAQARVQDQDRQQVKDDRKRYQGFEDEDRGRQQRFGDEDRRIAEEERTIRRQLPQVDILIAQGRLEEAQALIDRLTKGRTADPFPGGF